jgi:carbon storage regulator
MLVLSRLRDETIMIGDEIEITVVDIRGDKVRLGITAPRDIQVHRKEVYEAIKRENADSTGVQIDDLNVANRNLRQMKRQNGASVGAALGARGIRRASPPQQA